MAGWETGFTNGLAAGQASANQAAQMGTQAALLDKYGPIAGDPQLAQQEQNYQTSLQLDPLKIQGASLQNQQAQQTLNFLAKKNPLLLQQLGLTNTGLAEKNQFNAANDPLLVQRTALGNQQLGLTNTGLDIKNREAQAAQNRQAFGTMLTTMKQRVAAGEDPGQVFDSSARAVSLLTGTPMSQLGQIRSSFVKDPNGTLQKAYGAPLPGGQSGPPNATKINQSSAPFTGGLDMDAAAQSIKDIESSGGNYQAVGKQTANGDRAYGAYQIMGANIGPWTQEVLGKAMTPAEFVADPAAQDAVFHAKFGQLAAKYGPAGAAQAWFAGEGGMKNKNATDVNGTSVGQYGNEFSQHYQGYTGGHPEAHFMTPPPTATATLNNDATMLSAADRASMTPLQRAQADYYNQHGTYFAKGGHQSSKTAANVDPSALSNDQLSNKYAAVDAYAARGSMLPGQIDQAITAAKNLNSWVPANRFESAIGTGAGNAYEKLVSPITHQLALFDWQNLKNAGISTGRINQSEFEAFSKAYGNLEVSQDPGTIIASLQKIKEDLPRILGGVNTQRAGLEAEMQKRGLLKAQPGTGSTAPAPPPPGVQMVTDPTQAQALPSGTRFMDPEGNIRMVP